PRFNPDATGADAGPPPGELPREVDERQMSLFGAGWTAGSLKYLAESGAESVTYYETTGWRGAMETEAGCLLPGRFRSLPGSVFPMSHVFGDVGDFRGGEVVGSVSSAPLRVESRVLRHGGQRRLLLTTLPPEPQPVEVAGVAGSCRLRQLDETNAEEAM